MHYALNWNKRKIIWLTWSGGDGTLHTTPQPTTQTTCLDSLQNNSHILWTWHINYCFIRKDTCFDSTSLYNTVSIFFFSLQKKAPIWCTICSWGSQEENHKNTFCRATSFHKAMWASLCLILASNSRGNCFGQQNSNLWHHSHQLPPFTCKPHKAGGYFSSQTSPWMIWHSSERKNPKRHPIKSLSTHSQLVPQLPSFSPYSPSFPADSLTLATLPS